MSSSSVSELVTKAPDPRLQVKLNSALLPPKPRYRIKKIEELQKMEPLDELPEALIPGRVPGIIRLPPLLRKGYPITRATLCRLIDEAGFRPVPEGITPRFAAACIEVGRILRVRLRWPVQCYHVYGLPGPEEEALIVSISESYTPEREMPSDVQEQVKEQLQVKGPARWYLDSERSQWDWKEVFGMR